MQPVIRRIQSVKGRNLIFRDVLVTDAEFILSLRVDRQRAQYLSPVSNDLEAQRTWIKNYRQGQGQAYFVISTDDLRPIGTVRIYDAAGDSFSWGSWILSPEASATAAVESTVLVYWIGTRLFGFQAAHFNVNRANKSVISFHEKFGAHITSQNELEVSMSIDGDAIRRALDRYDRYLPDDS